MLKKFLYVIWSAVFVVLLFLLVKDGGLGIFLESMENRSFDIRQSVMTGSNHRKPSDDIVIVAIDDASYEYVLENYGEWPLKRDIYAKITDYIESQNPKSIAFDLMFVNSMKSDIKSDKALAGIFKKYDNVFTAMNLDDQPADLRVPANIPNKLALNIKNVQDRNDLNIMEYSNCRIILQDILDSTSNIGLINVSRSDDGVLRKMPLFLKYRGKYYAQLGLKVGLNYLGLPDDGEFYIKNDGTVVYENGKINFPADKDGSVILNWYGGAGTFQNIPLYKLIKAAEGKEKPDFNLKGKVVYFGATAASMFDIKTIPVGKVYPGVEVQATYVNNIIDGSFIKRCPEYVNVIAALVLSLLTILCVVRIASMPVAFGATLTIYAIYIAFAFELMSGNFGGYRWIKIISPLSFAILVFIMSVIIKYLIKSRDFDRQYKLATTDGLTELYNHRYFQEQLQNQINHSKRYGTPVSLIIIDIDFFKKFNDSYGHQSGDAVLRQVAFTLKKNVRQTDIVCRYGGEEMSIILPNTNYNEAVAIAGKLCSIVGSKSFKLTNSRESGVTISLGVSSIGDDGETPSQLIESADKRLYNAKENGRNRVN